jgi:hypothetical protein
VTGSVSEVELLRRLSSIEDKLDRLVRVEERQATHDDSLRRSFERIERVEDRVRVLEISAGQASVRVDGNAGSLDRIIGFVLVVAAGLAAWWVKGG